MNVVATSQCSRFAEQDIGVDLKQVQLSVNGKDLLVDAHVQFNTGVHYGLLGRNGVGKSILLQSLANGALLSVELRELLRVMLIHQTLLDGPPVPDGKKEEWTVREELQRKPFGLQESSNMTQLEKWQSRAEHRSGARGKEAREMVLQLEAKLSLQQQQQPSGDSDPNVQVPEDAMGTWAEEAEDDVVVDEPALQRVLKTVRLSNIPGFLDRDYAALSGGWKMRVQLAKAVLYQPDLLLLDEPTNHLDIAGIQWLQRMLNDHLAHLTIVLVSHNRDFLNHVTQKTVIFKNRHLEYYDGNYDHYMQTITEKQLFADRLQGSLDRKKERMQTSIQQNLALAKRQGDDKRLKQVASRKMKMEERLGLERNARGHRFKLNRDRIGKYLTVRGDIEHVEVETVQSKLRFTIPTPAFPRTGGPLLVLEDVWFTQRLRPEQKQAGLQPFTMKGVTFSATAGQHVAILGPNGQGKSTLLNLIADEWTPEKGSIQRNTQRIGYFKQDMVAELGKCAQSPLERMMERYAGEKQEALWQHVGAFGLGASQLATHTQLREMSGGQRVAYAFAELTYAAPSLLLLDEPNSHLDLEALEALGESLAGFEGALVLVSHDLAFVRSVATEVYWVEAGTLTRVEGGLEEAERKAFQWKSVSP